jgi:hypothetical protein
MSRLGRREQRQWGTELAVSRQQFGGSHGERFSASRGLFSPLSVVWCQSSAVRGQQLTADG